LQAGICILIGAFLANSGTYTIQSMLMAALQAIYRPLTVRAQAVASSPAETAVSTTIILKQCELSFGDTVKAVGESDVFGSWDSDKAPELQWQEGHDWLAKLDVLPGNCTFKVQ